MIEWLLLTPLVMFLNGVCGGEASHTFDRLPGRALFYVSFTMGVLVSATFSWQLGLISGLGFLLWRVMGWGMWFDLHTNDAGSENDPRRKDWYVMALDFLSWGNDYIAFFLRHLSMGVFFFLAVALYTGALWYVLLSIPFSVILVAIYHFCLRTSWSIRGAEYLTGVVWTAVIALAAIL